jgi:hypothetical protein
MGFLMKDRCLLPECSLGIDADSQARIFAITSGVIRSWPRDLSAWTIKPLSLSSIPDSFKAV